MGLFGKCEACEARKEEIDHLRAELDAVHKHLETVTKRLTEIADPGIDRRLRPPRKLTEEDIKAARSAAIRTGAPVPLNYPGYERPPDDAKRYEVTDE